MFTDGLGVEGETGAAVILYKKGKRIADLKYHLGILAEHTTYEAEAVGVLLGLKLLQHMKDLKKATIFLDNQGVIQAITHCQLKSAQYILGQIHELSNRVVTPSRRQRIDLLISWISGHNGVRSNEEVDAEAKRAAAGDNSQLSDLPPLLEAKPLPYSLATVQQAFRVDVRQDWRSQWQLSPRYVQMSKINDNLPSQSYLSDTAGLTRAQSSLITHMRTGHALLNQHLYRIKQVPTPLCPACSRADESTHHYLFEC